MNYVLTSDAEVDLRGVIRYTRKQWGEAQVRVYVAKLEKSFARVSAGQGVFKEMSDVYPALRMARCEHHYVFCLPRQNEPSLIIAILHERMDLLRRLADRL